MSNLDAFSADAGANAGRIVPSGIVPADGSYVFCLGHDQPGFFALLGAGDYVEVSQTNPMESDSPPFADVIAFHARTRAPAQPPPAGYAWIASALIDGSEVGRRLLTDVGPIDWEWYIDIAGFLQDAHELAFRLTLTGPSDPLLVELEVPAFYLDAIAFQPLWGGGFPSWWVRGPTGTASPPPFITNEVPVDTAHPGLAASLSTTIDFDVMGFGVDVNPHSIAVQVDSVDAVIAGVAQGAFLATIGPQGEVVHVTITLPSPPSGPSLVLVTARLVNATAQSRRLAFVISSVSPETINDVVAVELERLRVTWTGTVQMLNPLGSGDALNPARYSLQASQPNADTPCVRGALDPAFLPRVLSVEPVQQGNFTHSGDASFLPSIVDLILDVEVTPGVAYFVSEDGVATPVGTFPSPNGPVTSRGDFTTSAFVASGFVLPWPSGRMFDLWRLLPRMNRSEDVTHDLLRFVRCLQEPANLLLYDIDRWPDILDVDRALESMLDAMLADLGNPFPFVLSVLQKRQLVRLLVAIYREKGTAPGIIHAVRFFLGIDVTITSFTGGTMQLGVSVLGGNSVPPGSDTGRLGSWVLGPGNSFALYCFRVVSPVSLTTAQIDQIKFIANYMKPGHTHLIEVVVPTSPTIYDPVEIGISELGVDWLLHA
jgi:phage tail-like protein